MHIQDEINGLNDRVETLRRMSKKAKDQKEGMMLIRAAEEHIELINELVALQEQVRWIPVEERFPSEQDGCYVLLSFANFAVPVIGRYEIDENGEGVFYSGDDDESLLSYGFIVNAWRRLPECYKEE